MIKKRKQNSFLLAITIILLIVAVLFLFIYFFNNNLNKPELIYSYNMSRDLDYNVNLNDNSFIENDSLEKGQTYISNLVKDIDANFKYKFLVSKKLNLKYSYNITTTIKGEYQNSNNINNKNSSEVWTKEHVLEKNENILLNDTSNFLIDKNYKIDFTELNNEVLDFKSSLKISINAYAIVTMNIKVFDNDSNELLDDSNITMNIPLNTPAFSIDEDYINENSNTLESTNKINPYNIYFLYTSIIFFVIDFILFTIYYLSLSNKKSINSKYKSDLNKILKSYGNIIVEIVNPVKTKLSGVIDVKDFNEMIDLEEELRTPILFYEIPGRNEGWFTIIHQEILYRYVLRDNNSQKKKS